MSRMPGPRHVLLIGDGHRRHARRSWLCAALRDDPEAFARQLAQLPPDAARALRARIQTVAAGGADPHLDRPPDLLDRLAGPIPGERLLASYRSGGRVLESLLRWNLENHRVPLLSVYGMQTRNLDRADEEVAAFLRAEAECAQRWAEDEHLARGYRFAFVGDRAAFDRPLQRSALKPLIEEWCESAGKLEEATRGGERPVRILAPYDPAWELNEASRGGRFDPALLPVPEPVDLVVRSGGGRSSTSGALPYQVAYSQYAGIPSYFPDVRVADFEAALATHEDRRRGTGL